MIARVVKLEDFPDLLHLGKAVEDSVEDGDKYLLNAASSIDFSYEAMQGYVINSMTSQTFKMFVLVDVNSPFGPCIGGFMTAMIQDIPAAKVMGFKASRQLFIPTMFKCQTVDPESLEDLIKTVEEWGISMGCEGLYGNVSPNGALNVFLEKYGCKEISRTLYRTFGGND